MLSSREHLQERQGQYAAPRHEYLQQLVDEFQRSPDIFRKEEVVANLANFAYDPINYMSLGRLRIMDLFLDLLDVDQEDQDSNNTNYDEEITTSPPRKHQLVEFAMGGICNCIADPHLQQQFIDGEGVDILVPYILEIPLKNEQIAPFTPSELHVRVSALSIAYFLLDSSAFIDITSNKMITTMQSLQYHSIVQIANTAAGFLCRYQELLAT
ncbi:unnamed protein product [Peronospora farinosa]|uniref:Armadillo repeat-containing protein 7 n=1 Tax=Peronospora farinosa TaxID=134698 RepID=A0AAV0SNF9_9STRA|nr:unnamed protein product [Peronospora farinosa]CAI5704191.1 unnamed protein product [Peronospora farinosa]